MTIIQAMQSLEKNQNTKLTSTLKEIIKLKNQVMKLEVLIQEEK